MRYVDKLSWALLTLGGFVYLLTLADAVPGRLRSETLIMTASLVLLILVMQGRPWSRRLRRWREGRCPACGYDLRHEFRGGCPECGWRRAAA